MQSMIVNGLSAAVHTPKALKSEFSLVCNKCGRTSYFGVVDQNYLDKIDKQCPSCDVEMEILECPQGLPPYSIRPAYVVDEYPACPNEWMHGSGKSGSFFVPVETGRGMWFDFTSNQSHKHHVAVVISVQGINPVTGHKTNNDLGLRLQQIKNKCPKHNVDLLQDRYCPECKYKLPAQNYIATTTGQTLWIDGFRGEDGQVRQYIITEEDTRGVAAQIMGEERVWAIGFAFYLSKEPKPEPPAHQLMRMYADCTPSGGTEICSFDGGTICSFEDGTYEYNCTLSDAPKSTFERTSTKRQEIGGGARIQQEIGVDPENLDFWREEPEALIYVNYVQPTICEQILASGKRKDAQDGFLEGLKIGN